jgi:two-component system, LytTR family, sensor histidine kinase AlgZ
LSVAFNLQFLCKFSLLIIYLSSHYNEQTAVRKNTLLPNLHNFGIHLRVLLIVNMLTMTVAILFSHNLAGFLASFTELSTTIQPILIFSLVCLYLLYPLLQKLTYTNAILLIFLLEIAISSTIYSLYDQYLLIDTTPNHARITVLTIIITGIVLYYFHLYQRAYSPAIAEARLQALQARIRPHFLFNSINAVLSLIRSQPKQAETALEDMADLFRVLMADNRELVPLAQEIALCRQYLSLEKLRLGARLNVHWQIDQMTDEVMIPPLILQPLFENAVYHGIEPLADGGEINVQITHRKKETIISINNPCSIEKAHHSGNKMALKNIKERLLLHFDLEASLQSELKNNRYQVQIQIPNKY